MLKLDTATRSILAVVLFTLLCYIEIGLQMVVVSLFVKERLGFSLVWAGFAVSVQYLATFGSRGWAGNRIDIIGPKKVVVRGLVTGVLSGLVLVAAQTVAARPMAAFALVLLARIALGISESMVATAALVWNIRRVGTAHTAQVISWNGVCSYGGIALGAPVAMGIYQNTPPVMGGLSAVGLCCAALMALGLPWAAMQPAVRPLEEGKRLPFLSVLGKVAPYGVVLAGGSIGFGAISSLYALYFVDRSWQGAATGLSAFGVIFVLTRFVLTGQIARHGGLRVAMASLLAEACGLAAIALAPTPVLADLGAALAGAGFALLFPALGVSAVAKTGPESRGAAIGAFSVFLDIAIGLSGPLLGMIVPLGGYMGVYLSAAVFSVLGAAICLGLISREG
ncbi:MFS transporter [Acetobacter sp. TBRC 12305]|uniref:MFS transporter n=1 Tax=Acetobacter garciniae TaxID=2817435 RepID=A0A939HNS9_9PROT|nr:MFS transporter [Acetobacter garciniae]MBO1324406.1 MFS transporter [Acetobacter garciniae]MBX0344095.1 MFS transporter [Acetobacter garciniae]